MKTRKISGCWCCCIRITDHGFGWLIPSDNETCFILACRFCKPIPHTVQNFGIPSFRGFLGYFCPWFHGTWLCKWSRSAFLNCRPNNTWSSKSSCLVDSGAVLVDGAFSIHQSAWYSHNSCCLLGSPYAAVLLGSSNIKRSFHGSISVSYHIGLHVHHE